MELLEDSIGYSLSDESEIEHSIIQQNESDDESVHFKTLTMTCIAKQQFMNQTHSIETFAISCRTFNHTVKI